MHRARYTGSYAPEARDTYYVRLSHESLIGLTRRRKRHTTQPGAPAAAAADHRRVRPIVRRCNVEFQSET